MKLNRFIVGCITLVSFSLVFNACQKLDRPEMGEPVLDPDPPPYEPLKSFWAFEGNANDAGENKLTPVSSNVSYVAGVTGQAVKIGEKGYISFKGTDTVRYPNGFVGISADTLRNLGSFTYSFWMNAPGPVQGGAQGVFAISHKTAFWGNMEVFLENHNNAADPSEVWLKIHMFNAGVASGNGEKWVEPKIPGVLNKWSHIAIVYDGATSQFSLYTNGTVVPGWDKTVLDPNYKKVRYNEFNGMVLGSFAFQTNPSMTNHGPEDWAKSLNGSLDQFRLYNKALTAAEIQTLYTTKQ